MRRTSPRLIPAVLMAGLPLLLLPLSADAQEMAQTDCTATVTPTSITAGQKAVKVDVALSSAIGGVKKVEAPEASGLSIASPADLAAAKVEMARPSDQEETAEPVKMSDDGRSATLWLTTEHAKAGTFDLTLEGEGSQTCKAKVKVEAGRTEGSS